MAFSFGAAAPQSKPAFGFGSAPATTAPGGLFGGGTTGFGPPAASTSGFGFGGTGGTFGTTATSVAPSFGFGATPGTTTTSAGFGTGFGFGAGTSTLGGTGAAGGLAAGTAGFGTGVGTGGFGASTFGAGTGASGLAAGPTGFGAATGFGTNAAGFGGTAGFGAMTGLGIGQQQVDPQQQAALQMANMATAVSLPVIFGDERDNIVAKWNQLQAFWGSGKGFYNQQGAAVDFTPDNPFCRFKAVGYSCLPNTRNKDGLVCIVFSKKLAEVEANQSQIVLTLHKILGSKPNLTVCVESVRSLPDDTTEMIIFVQERAASGATKRLLSTEVFNFMNQQNVKTHLQSQLSVSNLLPKSGMTQDQRKQYLDTPPAGIDPLIWNQAKLDNPDPEKLIPVPMICFTELHRRQRHQDQQTKLHQKRLDIINTDISELQQKHTDMLAKIEQYKRGHLELGHRVLQVMVRQEVYRKLGFAIQVDEEQLRVQLEASQAELNAPTQFKGRLNEMMSQMRMQNQLGGSRLDAGYQIDESVQQEIKQHLKQQQEGIQLLISIIKDDLQDLQLIENNLSENPTAR